MYRGSFEEYSQLEGRIREGDQFGFYNHLKGMDVEGKRTFNSHYIRDKEGSITAGHWTHQRTLGKVVL